MVSMPRGIRTACDFCHNKRIKCKREAGASKCIQCISRDQECKFSMKEKTGPKPKYRDGKGAISSSLSPEGSRYHKHYPQARHHMGLPSPGSLSPSSIGDKTDFSILTETSPTSERMDSKDAPHIFGDSSTDASSAHLNFLERERTPEIQALEDKYLAAYLGTIAKLLPFCEEEVLIHASQLRRGHINLINAERPLSQAFLSAALAIGSLMFHDYNSDFYHQEARSQLKRVFASSNPAAAGILSMLGFYWLCRGENAKKDTYLQNARLGLSNSTVPLNIQLIIDHLDYHNRASLRPDSRSMTSQLRTLHAISCLLSDMSRLMSPLLGSVFAQAYCQELHDCRVGLEIDTSEVYQLELPRLLCYSLRAFLLVLLGRRDEAIASLANIPALMHSNPLIVRALPLSWDSSIIAGSLAFILGMKNEYHEIFKVVDAQRNTCIATHWACRLPEPESSLQAFLNHKCLSSSNICSIVCLIGTTTKCGTVMYYEGFENSNRNVIMSGDEQQLFDDTHGNESFDKNALKTDMIASSMGPIEDIKDVFPTDASLSHQMLGFILAQTDSEEGVKGPTHMNEGIDDRRHSSFQNMSFGSFMCPAGGQSMRNLPGFSDGSLANILNDAEFDSTYDEWTTAPRKQQLGDSYVKTENKE